MLAQDLDPIEDIAARLRLRHPNREALESIVFELAQHYEVERKGPPFEAVIDSATGVGKTYILAAAIEYLAGEGIRNFAVIVPGRTILEKTVANFTPSNPKSLLGGMGVRPAVITSENFANASVRAAMDDPRQVKLFIFTVQALTKPKTKLGKRTHEFQEGLGEAFYAHLQALEDLVVFADEHHIYYGPAFSEAVRGLEPWALLGLTATPHPKTPPDSIIYRYPLAAAIADRLVKTPVLVGRKDDRKDVRTKLLDGIRLLELKEAVIERYRQETGAEPVNPVMLVIAKTIDEAEEVERELRSPDLAGGRYADRVLTVHSNAPDEALHQLERLEEPDSPYRIVISVGMLKEGWDVKNVYVIASLRASVSEILTEQTLGRGLRLPFGRYTGIELLDTLEVLGHERYEELLKKSGVINQQFIDRRTRAVLRQNAQGQLVAVVESVEGPPLVLEGEPAVHQGTGPAGNGDLSYVPSPLPGRAVIETVEEYTARAEREVTRLQVELPRRVDLPPLRIPLLRMTPVQNPFSLADIDDVPFRVLGERIAANPDDELRRVAVDARIVESADGLRHTVMITRSGADHIHSPAPLFGPENARAELAQRVLASPIVPARREQRRALEPLLDAFIRGLGPNAGTILGGYMDRAAAGMIGEIERQQRLLTARPRYDEVVEIHTFDKTRLGREETSEDRFAAFHKGVGYTGFRKSLYAQDWFDSSTERDVANILEDAPEVSMWLRPQRGDLPILFTEGGREYNPDFIAVDGEGTHWIVEAKMDREMASGEVQAKREAARRWARHVSADPQVGGSWRYLLVSETDVRTAKGSWDALKRLGE